VAVVVAEDELPQLYPRFADQIRRGDMLLGFSLLVSAAILLGGYLTLRSIGRSLRRIEGVSARMRQFDFVAADSHSPFRDIEDVMQGLELAKTAMRALSKYVPVDLVRILYRTGREPVLGGELTRVSLLFTDIQGFTTLSEQLPPNELAQVLGRYLEVMTAAIQSEQGTIDKYIGDAIMAVWNAPTACPEHARRACAAALAALGAGQRLFGSPEWQGRPPLATRFGIHTDQVMVGHFGAPNRMSYTCLGDGVNLAARLEGLNKQYATTILVSEAVQREAGPHFQFRLVDVVAVKGKHQGVPVYELIGAELVDPARLEQARRYEQAFALYRRRDFEAARALLVAQPDDGPSRVLAERCAQLAQDPPPPDWDGVFVAMSK
jgi:adenylate cyclase